MQGSSCPDPALWLCYPYLPKEPRTKEQEEPFREQPHLPGRPRRVGQGGSRVGPDWAQGEGLRAEGGGASSGSGQLGPRTERGAKRGAGGGARAGEKVGSESSGWRGAGLRGAPIAAAPRAPPPAQLGARKVTFTVTHPGHAPGSGVKLERVKGFWGRHPKDQVLGQMRARTGRGTLGSGL